MRRHKKWIKGSRSAAGRVLAGILAFSLFGQAGAVYASAAGTGGGEKTAVTAEKDSTEEGLTEVITQRPVSGESLRSRVARRASVRVMRQARTTISASMAAKK